MKLRFSIGLILLSLLASGRAKTPEDQAPIEGILDLRDMQFEETRPYILNGEWEFYWEKLLTPENYLPEKVQGSGVFVSVPSYWNTYEVEGQKLTGSGYGTYALAVILPENFDSELSLDIPVFDVAYKFFLNDRLVRENGTLGNTRENEEPGYDPGIYSFKPDRDTLQILIQVSNFHHRRGGFWKPVYISSPKAMQKKIESRSVFYYSSMGTLLFFTIFFFVFWLFYKQNRINLFFALTSTGILIRLLNTGIYFSTHLVNIPWDWLIRLEYLGTYMAHLFGIIFLHHVFPKKYMRLFVNGNTIVSILLIISVFALPPSLFAYGMYAFFSLNIIFLFHYLVISITGTLRGRMKDSIFFITLALFIFVLVNDILVSNSGSIIYESYLTEISFQLFILSMSIMVILDWVNNHQSKLRLESSLRFKTKVLSVIAHDLKNPVASVAQFVDLLTAKPELAGKKEIMSSLNESSQAAVTLLDNLLYWGRNQADELKISPVDLDLHEMATEVQSLYTHMALQKKVELSFSVPRGTMIYADKALVNIIIRNLVSNAIKFTPPNGSVSFQALTDKDYVVASVSDTGVGIKADILEQFRNEGQMDSSVGTEKEIGTGLGLQLVGDLLAKNNGTLKVESIPEEGSTFTFTLPTGKTKNNENI